MCDTAHNIIQITELAGIRGFQYDNLHRLTVGGPTLAPEFYSYDEEGNRITSHLSSLHVVDVANRLLEDDQFFYGYDTNGNLTSKTDKISSDVTTYSYNDLNQLTRIDFSGGGFTDYLYDAFGRRVEKDVNGTVTRYIYDGNAIVMEFDGSSTLLARYNHANGTDRPLSMERAGQSLFYHADHLGSIRLITDAAGNIANQYDYDSYGNFEARIEAVQNPFAFTGREFDPESGLYYYRARYYDPVTGRFLTEDPIGFASGDLNLFRYVRNNPVRFVDPSGLNSSERAAVDRIAAAVAVGTSIISRQANNIFFAIAVALTCAQPGLCEVPDLGGSPSLPPGGANPGPAPVPSGPPAGVPGSPGVPASPPGFASQLPPDSNVLAGDTGVNPNILGYIPPPETLPAYPDAKQAKKKTPFAYGKRERWKDRKGRIYEWDYKKGEVEIYDKRGKNHKGGFNPDTGKQVTPKDPSRTVEP